jgi:hypothetical protein
MHSIDILLGLSELLSEERFSVHLKYIYVDLGLYFDSRQWILQTVPIKNFH